MMKIKKNSENSYSELFGQLKSIDNQFILNKFQRIINQRDFLFLGVDVKNTKWVHITFKQQSNSIFKEGKTKKIFKDQICPKILFEGFIKLGTNKYYCEVYEKLGPSLETLFSRANINLIEQDLYQLLLQMLKLLQKIYVLNLVVGQLDPSNITFSENYQEKKLHLFNLDLLKTRDSWSSKSINTKFCSKGAHLGRNIYIKDDLQSICYILIDIYTKGTVFTKKPYLQQKHGLWTTQITKKMPPFFLQFFKYVTNLNITDDIKFYHWKFYLGELIPRSSFQKPYNFFYKRKIHQKKKKTKKGSDHFLQLQNDASEIEEHIQQQNLQSKLKLRQFGVKEGLFHHIDCTQQLQ